jgi:thioredoxin-related protein
MGKDLFADSKVRNYLKNYFINFKVDFEKTKKKSQNQFLSDKDLSSKLNAASFPTVVFLNF